jgi:hypothetical protein
MSTKNMPNKHVTASAPEAEEFAMDVAAPENVAVAAGKAAHELVAAISSAAAVVPAAARTGVSTDLTSELNNIDFKKMIGAPLQAAVDAQIASSLATVSFIQQVGFRPKLNTDGTSDPEQLELVMADFTHTRKGKDAAGADVDQVIELKVPLIAILRIPSLRIEHVIIDFNVKLNSVETATMSDKLGVDASVQGGWGRVQFKVSASYQRQTTSGVEVKKEYSLNVNVKAVEDEMPAGLEKVLGMLAA